MDGRVHRLRVINAQPTCLPPGLDCVDGAGRSALLWASFYEALDGVAARLIAAGARLDLVDKDGDTALILACTDRRAATALLLVDAGAALDTADASGRRALDWADEKGLEAVSAAIRTRGGRTVAENKAARELGARDKAARAALAPEAARVLGEQLLEACEVKDAALALRLIGEGADVDFVNEGGVSPLIAATRYEALDAVASRLIASGARLDAADVNDNSAITSACFHKRAATALLLVEAGASLDRVTDWGKSALDYAEKRGLAAVSAALRARGARTGAELKAHLPLGEQLLWACKRKDVAAALRLISDGADLNCIGKYGQSPLLMASASERLDAVAARLIAAGADLEIGDEYGFRALMWACIRFRSATALLLVEAGASLNHTHQFGKTALDLAEDAAVFAAIRARGGRTSAELLALARAS